MFWGVFFIYTVTFFSPSKKYVVSTLQKHFGEVLLMSTTTCFPGEIRKISILFGWEKKHFIWHYIHRSLLYKMNWNVNYQGPVVQSVVSLTSSLRVISLTVLADSIYNILTCFAEKMWVLLKLLTFFQQKIQHTCICISLDVNFNESLTNDIVSFEQLGPDRSKLHEYHSSR